MAVVNQANRVQVGCKVAPKIPAAVSAVVTYDYNTMTEPKPTNKPKRLRRICWCSLAVVVLLASTGLLAFVIRDYSRQQAAIALIKKFGGSVPPLYGGEHVGFHGSEITDDGLKQLRKHWSAIPNLQGLYLGYTEVTDEGLRHLSGAARQ